MLHRLMFTCTLSQMRCRCAMYISTLGVARPFRKLGVARELVRRVYEAADEQPNCLALYLHVLKSNRHAIHFYESLRFSCVNTLQQFYWCDGIYCRFFLQSITVSSVLYCVML